jgi:AcrR family transcriptional regulator
VPLWQLVSYIVLDVTAGTSRLTERKKEWTRREIAQAAADLFAQRGYAETTVNDIVAAAEVSPRTFFRYFPAKEDLVLALGETGTDGLLTALRARPREETPLAAVQAAVAEAFAPGWNDRARVKWFFTLLSETPPLLGRWLEERDRERRDLAAVLAGREGTEPGPRHLIAAAAVETAIRSALSDWADGDGPDPGQAVSDRLALLATPLLPGEAR